MCDSAIRSFSLVMICVISNEVLVTDLTKDERAYHLLEHVGTKPNVVYHVKVRNTQEA